MTSTSSKLHVDLYINKAIYNLSRSPSDSHCKIFLYYRQFPTTPDDYELLEECGRGVSATVSPHFPSPVGDYKLPLPPLSLSHIPFLLSQHHHPSPLPLPIHTI